MAVEGSVESPRLTMALIALACTILKHKPNGISAREYVLKLRARVVICPPTSCREYVDGILYWRNMFQDSQYEIHQLQSKFGALVKENESLRVELASGKRKASDDCDMQKIARRKTMVEDSFDCDLTTIDFPENIKLNGKAVLSHLYNAHKLCLDPERPYQDIAHHLISITIALSEHLDQLEEKSLVSSEDDSDIDLIQEFRATSRSFGLALQLLSQLRKICPNQNCVGAVIFKSIKLFHQVLDRITKLSIRVNPQPNMIKSKSKNHNTLDKFLNLATRLFLEFIGLLSPSCSAHLEIFEGVVYLVLDRCGKLLYILSFGHRQPREDIVREILEDQESFVTDSTNLETRRAALEAKWVFILLKRLMGIAPAFYRPNSSTSGASSTMSRAPSKLITKTSAKLPLDARQRFQKTLINCIWEDEDRKSTDPLFRDTIQKPSFNGNLPSVPEEADNVNGKYEWFVQEVWKLVGWDILSQKNWTDIS